MKKLSAMNVVAERFTLISQLLGGGLDSAEISKLRREIQLKSGLSDRTLRRYVKAYQEKGLEGLAPLTPQTASSRSISETIFQEALLLRREVPQRSVRNDY